jgi:acetyl-CoA carboxylase biotin carboxyl carrier protein
MATKFSVDGDAIRQLAAILSETDLSEIEYEDDGRRIRVARHISGTVVSAPTMTSMPMGGVTERVVSSESVENTDYSKHPGVVKSPMVGTVYVAPEPGAAPFVKVGDTVSVGQTLIIIEAMKVMNPIKAPRAGKITHILIQDGSPVEFGEPLMIIE